MKIKKSQLKQLLLEEVGGYIFDKVGKISPANLQQALDTLFQRLKDEDKAEDSKNEATEEDLENKEKEVELQKALNTELEKTNDLVKETTEEEAWNHFYSKGVNQGMSEDDAARYADEKAEEYLTTLAELTSAKKKIR